jgi:hypothetical protein
MERNTFPIDWRNQFADFKQFLDTNRGVAHIRYAGERCAPNSFAEALTSLFEGRTTDQEPMAANDFSRSVRIDRDNYKVRYLSGIRTEFMRKMKLELPSPISGDRFSQAVHIASNNTAGGNQNINTRIYVYDNEVSLRFYRDKWIKSLCHQIKDFLQNHRFMVILMHGSKEDQQEFWDDLWHKGMSDLVNYGLFLVRMIDTSDPLVGEHHYAAQPDYVIPLPLELDHDGQDHAIDDLANFIIRRVPGLSIQNARDIAKGYVLAHTQDIDRLHNQLIGFMLNLKQKATPNSS